jgi:hypothetical protein
MKHLLAAIVCWARGHNFPDAIVWGAGSAAFYCRRGCGRLRGARRGDITGSVAITVVHAEFFA